MAEISSCFLYDMVVLLIEDILEVKEIFATAIQKYGKEYYEQGIEQGRIEDARRMFNEGFDKELIARITGFSDNLLEKIQNAEE